MAAAAGGRAAAQISASEYEVKAAYLLNFARYVEWPSEAFESPQATVVIGILGEDPFGEVLDLTVADRRAQERRLTVRRFKDPEDVSGCHILFLGRSERGRQESYLEAVRGRPLLTVGEAAGFLRDGGAIRLVTVGQNIRFDVNPDAVRAAGLKIRSRMLALARNVEPPKSRQKE